MIYVIIAGLLTCLLTTEAIDRRLGPADLRFHYMRPCTNDAEEGFNFRITQRRYNRTVYFWNISLDTEYVVDNSMIIEINIAMKRQVGGYRRGVYYRRSPVCEVLRTTFRNLFKEFLEQAVGVEDCPIPPGSYYVNDFQFDNDKFTDPQLYGEYEMTADLYKHEEHIYCLKIYYALASKEA